MKLKIKASSAMASKESPLGSVEDRLIRIPSELREELGIQPGLFLYLKGKTGESIPLQVCRAYIEDAVENNDIACVSNETHSLLDIREASSIKPVNDILIGCDPEFFLVDKDTGHNVSASHFFPHYGEVGSDCGLAELRPRPSTKEKDIVVNLNKLMRKAYDHIEGRALFRKKNIKMLAASQLNNASAGFHIHFGLPQILLGLNSRVQPLLPYIVHILDYYVAVPAVLPEGSDDFRRRSARFSKFGKPGDCRVDMMTLEYRVPGGHLLRHPLLSSGLLALGVVVIKDILSRLAVYSDGFRKELIFREYKELKNLYPNLPEKGEIWACVTDEKVDKALSHMDILMKDISNMIGYKDGENPRAIVNYFDYVLSYLTSGRGFNMDLESNWRLAYHEEQSRKMAVL